MGEHAAVTFFGLLVEGTEERGDFWAQKKVTLREFGVGLVYFSSVF